MSKKDDINQPRMRMKGEIDALQDLITLLKDQRVKDKSKETWQWLNEKGLVDPGEQNESEEMSQMFKMTEGDYMTEEDLDRKAKHYAGMAERYEEKQGED